MYVPINKFKPSGAQGKQTVKALMDQGTRQQMSNSDYQEKMSQQMYYEQQQYYQSLGSKQGNMLKS
jgi:hypothetical protein